MAKNLKRGDKVGWNTSQGETQGVVEKKLTSDTQIKQQKIKASPEDPKLLVKSSKSGKNAAHRESALKKKKP